IDMILLDLVLKNQEEGLPLLFEIQKRNPDADVIVVSGISDIKTVVSVMQKGASDYVTKPIVKEEFLLTIDRVWAKRDLRKQNQILKDQIGEMQEPFQIVGKSPQILEVLEKVKKLKGQLVNVLIMGETGTGKEIFARLLHRQENRS